MITILNGIGRLIQGRIFRFRVVGDTQRGEVQRVTHNAQIYESEAFVGSCELFAVPVPQEARSPSRSAQPSTSADSCDNLQVLFISFSPILFGAARR